MSREQASGSASRIPAADPFGLLGLQPSAELADDDVRAAWRVAAAATHPDRTDGGDPDAFAAAAVAYARLRTAAARAEALADGEPGASARTTWSRWLSGRSNAVAARIWYGRPGRLALRVLAVAALAVLALLAIGWQPASVAVVAGAVTWLTLTSRTDLAASRSQDR